MAAATPTVGFYSFIDVQGAQGAIYGTLACVFIYAIVFSYRNRVHSRDDFMSARRSINRYWLGLSFWVSGLGSYIFFSPTQTGTYAGILGVIGYSWGSAISQVAIAWLGPLVRQSCDNGITMNDWVKQRYGRATQILSALIALLYMFIGLCAEYTSVVLLVRTMVPGLDPTGPVVAIAISTSIYSIVGGLHASIATDQLQAYVVFIVLIVAWSAIWATSGTWMSAAYPPGSPDPVTGAPAPPTPTMDALAKASGFFDYSVDSQGKLNIYSFYGVENFILLPIGITAAQLFNQGFWQRVWSSRNDTELRVACYISGVLFIPVFMVQGALGFFAVWYNTIDYVADPTASAAFFSLINQVPLGIRVLILILSMALSSGAVDTAQIGIAALFANDFGVKVPLMQSRLMCLLINAPAMAVALVSSAGILQLYLIADLACTAAVIPVFLGLWGWSKMNGLGIYLGWIWGLGAVVFFGGFFYGSVETGFRLLLVPADLDNLAPFLIAPVASWLVAAIVAYGCHYCPLPAKYEHIRHWEFIRSYGEPSPLPIAAVGEGGKVMDGEEDAGKPPKTVAADAEVPAGRPTTADAALTPRVVTVVEANDEEAKDAAQPPA